MNEQENPEQQEELSTEERFKETVEKFRPYIHNLWAARWKIFWINLGVAVITVLILLFLVKPYFTSTVTILPDYGSKETTLGSLSSLASLAGVNVGSGSPTEIYQNLIMSESVLGPVINSKYMTEEYPDSVNLIQFFEIRPDKSLSPDLQKRKMFIQEMNSITKGKLVTYVDRMTKILTLSVTMPEARLSADVANKISESLDNYIRTKRKSYASEQRKYVEKRLIQVKDSLAEAENLLVSFKEKNRLVSQSPALNLEQSRLLRNIEILNAVYLELSKQLELAKIDEVKDTPVINVMENVKTPVTKTGPHYLTLLIMISFFALVLSSGYFMFLVKIRKYYRMIVGNK